MVKTFRIQVVEFDARRENKFTIPDKCLSATVVNNGVSTVVVDSVTYIARDQAFPIPPVPGYYLKQTLKIQIVKDGSELLQTKVRIRLLIENDNQK